jgi:2-keto-4-pentenoate hydratase
VASATRRLLDRRRASLDAGALAVGWKLSRNFAEIEAVIGAEPILGYLTSETVIESGATFSLAGLEDLRVETEWSSRSLARCPGRRIIAGNSAHRAVVFGPSHAPATLEHGSRARLTIDGLERAVAPVAATANLLAAVDLNLASGDRILAGSLPHVEAHAGDSVSVEIDHLGRVQVTLVP